MAEADGVGVHSKSKFAQVVETAHMDNILQVGVARARGVHMQLVPHAALAPVYWTLACVRHLERFADDCVVVGERQRSMPRLLCNFLQMLDSDQPAPKLNWWRKAMAWLTSWTGWLQTTSLETFPLGWHAR